MNVIFLTMSRITSIKERGIYPDLIRKFRDEGHSVYIVTPHERSFGRPTELIEKDGVHILGVKTLNLQKTNLFEKGLGQVLVERQYQRAIKVYFEKIDFNLILYSTPPITLPNVIYYLKKINPSAKTYLLLKDIFPQNALDIGMMSKTGVKGILYHYFRKKEKKLYALSDYIGCMSPANVDYVLRHNPEIESKRVEVAPNSIELDYEYNVTKDSDKYSIRAKYGIPTDKLILIYGGNLGRPQGIPFLIDCLRNNSYRHDCFFVVIGTGTELPKLMNWISEYHPNNVTVLKGLPTDEYKRLVQACDIGLVFLDYRFTIPNFPSRILSYMENRMPVLCATDPNTDIGRIAEENGFGYWCESNSVEAFNIILDKILCSNLKAMGEKGYSYLCQNFLVSNTYNAIINHL